MIGNLVGHYKIVEKIGEGGMGAVFRGIDIMLEREVAIKMLRPELANQPEVVGMTFSWCLNSFAAKLSTA